MNPDVPLTNADFFEPSFVSDPYPVLEEIRGLGPISFHEEFHQFVLTGWRDCARVLGNVETFATDPTMFLSLFGDHTMESMERPRHDLVKGIWASDFQRATLESRRALIVEVVDAYLMPFVERLRDGEDVDAVQDLTRHIPTMIIARMMGIPTADHKQFAIWSDRMGDIVQGMQDRTPRGEAMVREGRQATSDLNDFLQQEIAQRRTHSHDDLIGHMVDSRVADEHMTEGEVIASNTQLVFAGNETTAKLMSHILLALALHPAVREQLRQDRTLIPQAIEEIHRWNTISQVAWRTVRGPDAIIAGHRFEPGSVLMLLKGAANRDPARWDSPGKVDICRESRGHLGFGFGMHSCLGLNLARLEVQIWLDRLLDELPAWDVVDVDWGVGWTLRGPIRLSIRLGA